MLRLPKNYILLTEKTANEILYYLYLNYIDEKRNHMRSNFSNGVKKWPARSYLSFIGFPLSEV